jgi:glycosyltransferase involved in cell wall biosynthesis
MHVFFDEQIFVAQEQGGISRYFTELAGELGRGGLPVHVFGGITFNRYLPSLRGRPGVTAQWLHRRDRLRINTAVARISRLWARCAFAKIRRRSTSLIYHATNYAVDPWMAARADAVCVTVFDMIGELFGDAASRSRSLDQKRCAIALAQIVLCISDQTRRDLIALLPQCAERTAVTLLAASLPQPTAQEHAQAAACAPYLLMVGKRQGYKNGAVGLKTFAEMAKANRELRLVCFGGEKSGAAEEEALLPSGDLRSRVVLLSGGDGLLASFYANATGLLYPSRYEGFGLPVLEAMQLGCPVLTTRCASLPEVAGDAAVYVDPNDVSCWSRETARLLRDDGWRAALIEKGHIQAAHFSWRSTAQHTRAAYERALDRKKTEARSAPSSSLLSGTSKP